MDGSGIDAVPRPSIFISTALSRQATPAAPAPIFRRLLRAGLWGRACRSMAGVPAAPYVVPAAASCSPLEPVH